MPAKKKAKAKKKTVKAAVKKVAVKVHSHSLRGLIPTNGAGSGFLTGARVELVAQKNKRFSVLVWASEAANMSEKPLIRLRDLDAVDVGRETLSLS